MSSLLAEMDHEEPIDALEGQAVSAQVSDHRNGDWSVEEHFSDQVLPPS